MLLYVEDTLCRRFALDKSRHFKIISGLDLAYTDLYHAGKTHDYYTYNFHPSFYNY
jgi:hypothetical protein